MWLKMLTNYMHTSKKERNVRTNMEICEWIRSEIMLLWCAHASSTSLTMMELAKTRRRENAHDVLMSIKASTMLTTCHKISLPFSRNNVRNVIQWYTLQKRTFPQSALIPGNIYIYREIFPRCASLKLLLFE